MTTAICAVRVPAPLPDFHMPHVAATDANRMLMSQWSGGLVPTGNRLAVRGGVAGKLIAALAAFLATQVVHAASAEADTRIMAADICNQYSPGQSTRVVHVGRNYGACAVVSGPGLFSAPILIATIMQKRHHGAYPVNRADPFSDWIIPDG